MTYKKDYSETTGIVFDIQRYSLADGPGIRTTIFFKGCNLNCKWCQNPESLKPEPEIAFRSDKCINCNECYKTCTRNAIITGSTYRINHNECNKCGDCIDACPTKALFIIGKQYTVEELFAETERDSVFYEESSGGVTLSGGEATMQFDFIHAFLKKCKNAGLNTAIETNGLTTRKNLQTLLPYIDTIFFDLKIISQDEHSGQVGSQNKIILKNARFLAESNAKVIFRVPLVHDITDTETNIQSISEFLNDLNIDEIELCPYQNSWENKISWIKTDHTKLGIPSISNDLILAAIKSFMKLGIKAKII